MNGPRFNQSPQFPEQNTAAVPVAGESFVVDPPAHSESGWEAQGDLWDNPPPSSELTAVIPMEAMEANAPDQPETPTAYDESYLRQHRASRQRESAIANLRPGQKIAMSIPGRGNVLFTRRLEDEAYRVGEETLYRPAYDTVELNSPQSPMPASTPASESEPTRVVNPVRSAIPAVQEGPFMGVSFGPQGPEATGFGPWGDAAQAESRVSVLKASTGQPPEDSDPYADGVDSEFGSVLLKRNRQSDRSGEVPANPEPPKHELVEAKTPSIERITPEAVQAASTDADAGSEEDLADQLLRDEASPVAEMEPENHPDLTAVRRPGIGAAAAVEHAEKTGAAEQPSTGQPERRPQRAEDDEEVPQRLDELLPGVVSKGQELDFDPGGGQPRYRR